MAEDISTPRIASFGPYVVDLRSGELRKHGVRLRVGEQPFLILQLLLQQSGDVVTREELRAKLWADDTFVDFDHSLNSAVQRLRDCLCDSADQARWIETVPRRGYRFAGRVEWSNNGFAAGGGSGPGDSQRNDVSIDGFSPSNREVFPAEQEGRPAILTDAGKSSQEIKPSQLRAFPGLRVFPTIAALIVIVALGMAWFFRSPLPPPIIARTIQLTSDGREKLPPVATDGSRVYFTERVNDRWMVGAVSTSGGEVIPIRTPFQNAKLMAVSPDKSELLVGDGLLYQEKALWLVPLLGGSPHRFGNMLAHDAQWSPDGQKFAYVNGGDLYLAKADGTEPRKFSTNSKPDVWAWSPAWSPDGARLRFELYVMDKHTSAIWELSADGSPHPLLPGWQTLPMQCCGAWTPDGKYFLFDVWDDLEGGGISPAANIWAIREKGGLSKAGSKPLQLTAGPVHFFTQTPSSDGKAIFALSIERRGELMRYDTKTKQFAPYLSGISADGVSFSRDGVWMAYVKFPQGELWRSKADGSEPLQLTFRPLMAYGARWSPDGKRIAFCGQKAGTKWQPFIVSADGGAIEPMLPESVESIDPTWSPDGNSILFGTPAEAANPVLRILDLRTGSISAVPGSAGLASPRWSPDGHRISALTVDGQRLMLFNVETRKWSEQSRMNVSWQTWSRDGRYVYFAGGSTDASVFRVRIRDNKLEKIVDLKGFHSEDPFGGSFSLTPADEPLLLQDSGGGTEIYALDLGTS
jgi:DNA-binding winged helix-turn-helix (wHTH) protein/Tol biopolymer transport system component